MIIVSAALHARADSIEELRRLCLEHVARSRSEPGCLEHGVAADINDGLRLVFFERWEDRDALDAHFHLPGCRTFLAKVTVLAAQPPQLHVYEAEEVPLRR